MARHPHSRMFFSDAQAFDLTRALAFAIDLAEALGTHQAQGATHGQLCAANVLIEEGRVLLRADARDSLAYIAPEQTGRMNRKVDQRSDYYALGALLYEVFTGQLPFPAGDLMELVHAHIARLPANPASLNGALPPVLGQILMKLLAKNPEERYQTIAGLLDDLRRCQRALATDGLAPVFALGQNDRSARLQVPEKLYGRDAEVRQLLQAFSRTAQGGAEMALVSGYAGIGKSALVREIHQPVVRRRGYFASGKFDQFKRNIPYSAIHEALSELVRQVLAEDEARTAAWRVAVQQALGPNGQMMTESVPELAWLIGPQPPTPRSFTSAAAYSHAMQKLVSVFARSEHPLVLFLDDLQWADSASLRLIGVLLKELDEPCLLLIGAFRDTGDHALADDHPLAKAIAAWQAAAPVHRIALAPLPVDSVIELLADTFRCGADVVLPLARLVHEKTRGNPFFVGQFIRSLHNAGLLRFVDGSWRWDIGAIESLHITDNVVDLLTEELARLPAATRDVLALAACIGSRFEAEPLARLAARPLAEVQDALHECEAAGLIRQAAGALPEAGAQWLFEHDRVQQAAYEGIPAQERDAVHLAVGRALLESIPPSLHEERIFDIVPQLNQGRALLATRAEADQLAELNLLAAKRARESAALDVHLEFVRVAEELGGVTNWHEKPAFMHALTMEKVNAAFARGDYQTMATLGRLVAENSETAEQAIAAKNMLLRCYGSMYKPAELVETGLELMALAGIRAPRKPNAWHILVARARLVLALRGRDPLRLADFPEPTDKRYRIQLMATTALLGFGLAFHSDSRLIEWLSLELIRKAVRHGVSPESAYAFAVWASNLAGRYDKPELAYKFGKVGALLGARGSMVTLSTVSLFAATVQHRREPLRACLPPLDEVFHRASERGDRTGAVVAMSFSDSMRFHAGLPLDEALDGVVRDIRQCRRMDYPGFLSVMIPLALMLSRLTGRHVEEVDDGRTLEDHARERSAAKDPWGLFNVRAVQCVSDYLSGDMAAAFAHASEALALPGFRYGMPHSAFALTYCSLAELALLRTSGGSADGVRARQRRLRKWARHAPMNYLPKWQTVQAELLLQQGREAAAIALFEEAIEGARRHGYPGDEAIACELLGNHFARSGRSVEARAWLEEAHALYQRWGAHAKAQWLTEAHPQALRHVIEEGLRGGAASDSAQHLDLTTVIKVSQALSGEIQLDRLLKRFMQLLIENAGAQQGVLMLKKDGILTVQAKYAVRGGEGGADRIEVLQGTPAERDPDVCLAIVNYVRRTRETLVLGDVQKDARFAADAQARGGVRSVLCAPLMQQGQLAGILCLENNLATDAFTPAQTALLQVLSTQAAISLENASLVNELEQKIAARTTLLSQRNEELSDTLRSLRQTQRQLVESEKLASLGQLVAGVAHEINTPIGVAVTAASTLAEHTESLAAHHEAGQLRRSEMESFLVSARDISHLLLSNMERAAALVQSFKAVAVDQTSEERRRFPLAAYLHDVLLNLSPMLRKTEHEVRVECDSALILDSYPGALAQVITNLVTNALMHAFEDKPRGHIAIVVREIEDDWIELRFADDGRGIPAAILPRIFEPFFTTRRGRGGSGLGLNIAYNLVTGGLHGRLEVDSTEGGGTTFILRFPRTAPPQPVRTTARSSHG